MGAKLRKAAGLRFGTRFSFREALVILRERVCGLDKETIAHKLLTTAKHLLDPRKSTEADNQRQTDWQLVVALNPLGLQTTLSQGPPKTIRKEFLAVAVMKLQQR